MTVVAVDADAAVLAARRLPTAVAELAGCSDLENLCLLCDFHHDRIDTGGWTITMLDGVPWFVPPVWLDADQKPLRNVRT